MRAASKLAFNADMNSPLKSFLEVPYRRWGYRLCHKTKPRRCAPGLAASSESRLLGLLVGLAQENCNPRNRHIEDSRELRRRHAGVARGADLCPHRLRNVESIAIGGDRRQVLRVDFDQRNAFDPGGEGFHECECREVARK